MKKEQVLTLPNYKTHFKAKIIKVAVYPGEDEMAAMALNANMILNKEIEIQEYV